MRASLTARFVTHPAIDFGGRRPGARRPHLGLARAPITYHLPLAARSAGATVAALRPCTSTFRFPSVGRVGRVSARRSRLPLGLPRTRRG
jgi:hypothetical protein